MCVCVSLVVVVFCLIFFLQPCRQTILVCYSARGEGITLHLSSLEDKIGSRDCLTNVGSGEVLRYSDGKKLHRRVSGVSRPWGMDVGARQLFEASHCNPQ